jgi:ElaB/YqjD/DUF883 family membrane-anchored ribosome-binding protein
MNTQTTVNKENDSGVSRAFETAGKIAGVGVDLELLKKRFENAVDDAVSDAGRIVKHSKRAMHDVLEDTTYCIKKNPWQSVGFTAGASFAIGVLVGWLTWRPNIRRDH